MDRLDRLDFNFEDGACNVYLNSTGAEFILLCFDAERPRECRIYNDSNRPVRIAPSIYQRNSIRLGNYKGTVRIGKLRKVLIFQDFLLLSVAGQLSRRM